VRILVEVEGADDGDEACRLAREVEAVLERGHVTSRRLHHAHGPATWAVLRQAVELGRDIRVGLEDVLTLPDGRTARDNADLVDAAAEIRRLGSTPAG
jgi:uncharacterized protein (DUF849 family)